MLQDIIEEAVSKGIIVVTSAGNGGNDTSLYIPSCVKTAYVIAALDQEGKCLETSNRGIEVDYGIKGTLTTSEAAARFAGLISSLLAQNIDINNGVLSDQRLVSGIDILNTLENSQTSIDNSDTFTATAISKIRWIILHANITGVSETEAPESLNFTLLGSDGSSIDYSFEKEYGYTAYMNVPAYNGNQLITYRFYQHPIDGYILQYPQSSPLTIATQKVTDSYYTTPIADGGTMTIKQLTTNNFENAPMGDYRFRGIAMNNLQSSQITEMTGAFRLATVPVYKNSGGLDGTITTIVIDRN